MNRTWESPQATDGAVSAATMPASPRPERRDNLIGQLIVSDADSAKPRSKLEEALAELDPAERALLDLSLRKGFSDSKLAELSGTDEPAVVKWRTSLIGAIAKEVELDTPAGRSRVEQDLRGARDDAWLGRAGGAETTPSRRRVRALILVLALVAAIAVVRIIAGPGSDTATTSAPAGASTQSAPHVPAEQSGRPVALAPLAGAAPVGSATARITPDGSLQVRLKGLPSPGGGAYRLWLFNSVIDSTPIGALRSGDGAIRAELPPSLEDYRYLDLTREHSPADQRYSGLVVLRLPVRSLEAGASSR